MIRLHRAALVSVLMLCAGAATCAPVTYTIYSKLSRVNLNLEHQGFIQLFGTLKITPGNFVFDNQDWSKSSVAVTMPTKTLDMGDALWNQQIRGDSSWKNLFNSTDISFKSTRLERTDANNGVLHGDLTLAGVTKPVALKMRVNKIGRNAVTDKQAIGITASTTIKRSHFGLDAYADLVGDDLAVQIQLEAAVGPDPHVQQEAMNHAQGAAGQ
jgi:polyisoprenoid-binding protein YceI